MPAKGTPLFPILQYFHFRFCNVLVSGFAAFFFPATMGRAKDLAHAPAWIANLLPPMLNSPHSADSSGSANSAAQIEPWLADLLENSQMPPSRF